MHNKWINNVALLGEATLSQNMPEGNHYSLTIDGLSNLI